MVQGQSRSENTRGMLFLTDEQLRKGIEAMFFAYRGFTADPDRIAELISAARRGCFVEQTLRQANEIEHTLKINGQEWQHGG